MKLKMILIGFLITGCTSSTSIPKATVMVTNFAGNSGGSGTIVRSRYGSSEILTNAHVCGVVKGGGFIHTLDGNKHYVHSYKISENHDLCLITVLDNLGVNTPISSHSPKTLDPATTSGHPHLMPIIMNQGHFSEKRIIHVMTGFRDCVEDDMKNPNTALFCILMNKVPVIKRYESIVLSTLIQPGSSGSGVFAADGGLAAVVFAGSGDLSYGYAVPYEYVYKFLREEAKDLKEEKPSPLMDLASKESSSVKEKYKEEFEKICSEYVNAIGNTLCKSLEESTGFHNLLKN